MYADQLSSASIELKQMYNDNFIEDVRITPITDQTTTKIYDNFGSVIGIDKLFNQDYDFYSTAFVMQSYRQQLRLLVEAYLSATGIEGLWRVGHAYTGVAPIVTNPVQAYTGWALISITGSVAASGSGFTVSDQYVPHVGYVLPASVTTLDPGDTYLISYSKLGYNTTLYSGEDTFSGMDVIVYGSASVSSSFQSSIERSIEKVLKADQRARVTYSSNFAYYRPQSGTGSSGIDNVFSLSDTGYLYNSGQTAHSGSIFTGSVVQLPAGYGDYDWYYDWLVLSRNDANYTFSIRSYPSSSIPSTVYYLDYNRYHPVDYLGFESGSLGLHYVFNDDATLWDISGNQNNMIRVEGTGSLPTVSLARNEDRTGLFASAGSMVYTGSLGTAMDMNGSISCEMWVKGVDSSGTLNHVTFKRESSGDYGSSLTNDGYLFSVDIQNANTKLSIRNTTTETVTASISDYLTEDPSRYHYFAYSYASGSVFLYVDDQLVNYETSSVALPSLPGNVFTTLVVEGTGVVIDEIVVTDSVLMPQDALYRFETTKPRIIRRGIPSGSVLEYHQPKLTVYASGSNEVEFHQFSVRGLQDYYGVVFNENVDLWTLPLFEVISGSVL